jgi:hypothetical protein
MLKNQKLDTIKELGSHQKSQKSSLSKIVHSNFNHPSPERTFNLKSFSRARNTMGQVIRRKGVENELGRENTMDGIEKINRLLAGESLAS